MNKWFRVYRIGARDKLIAVTADTPRQLHWRGGRRYRRRHIPQNVEILGEKP